MMRNGLKRLYAGIIQFVDTLVSIFTIFLFSSFKAARNMGKLKSDREKIAYVLGNGPSLNGILGNKNWLDEILDGVSIVMNNFGNSKYFTVVKPAYYILLDPGFYNEQLIAQREDYQLLYKNLHHVDWNMTLFLVYGANWQLVQSKIDNPNIRVSLFNGTKAVGYQRFQNFSYKWSLGIPSSRNVIIPALQLMINIGFKHIYLYGAEFSWTKNIDVDPQNNKVFLNDSHFYKKTDILYYDKGWYKWYLEAVVEMLDGTERIAKYAESVNVKIINRTKGSFIDAFEYENPDTLFK